MVFLSGFRHEDFQGNFITSEAGFGSSHFRFWLKSFREPPCTDMSLYQFQNIVSASDRAKRFLVSLLKTLATTYGVVLQLSRDAADADVISAFRKVSRKAHPDRGGSIADQTALNNARDAWQDVCFPGRLPQLNMPHSKTTDYLLFCFRPGSKTTHRCS